MALKYSLSPVSILKSVMSAYVISLRANEMNLYSSALCVLDAKVPPPVVKVLIPTLEKLTPPGPCSVPALVSYSNVAAEVGKDTVDDVEAMMVHSVWVPMEFWFIVKVDPLEVAVVLDNELKFELVRMSPDEMDDDVAVTL